MSNRRSTILLATGVAGTLDLLSAFVFGGIADRTPMQILQGVASGPFGADAGGGGIAGAAIGALVHYAIMSAMVAAFVLAGERLRVLGRRPVAAGLCYGLILYLVMYWIVLPLRFPAKFPQIGWWPVGNALFSHLVCVGLPIALIAARADRRREQPVAVQR